MLVEQPGSRTSGRSVQVARVSPPNQARPMSADDIQKAKMRAIFMQSKYGKNGTFSNDSPPLKSEGEKTSCASQTRTTPPAPNVFHLKKEDVKKPVALPLKTSQTLPENSMDTKPRMAPHEPLWQKLKMDQIRWQTPPGTFLCLFFTFCPVLFSTIFFSVEKIHDFEKINSFHEIAGKSMG